MPRKPRALGKRRMIEWYTLTMKMLSEMSLYEFAHARIRNLTKKRFIKHLTEPLEEKL